MKKLKKLFATALTAALLVSILAAGASAAFTPDSNNCTDSKALFNLSQFQTGLGNLTDASGPDIGKLLEGLGLKSASPAGTSGQGTAADNSGSAGSDTPQGGTQEATYEALPGTGCTVPANSSAGNSAGTSNEPVKTGTAENSTCKTGACPAGTGCNGSENTCKSEELCLTGNCSGDGSSCISVPEAGKSLGNNSSLTDFLNRVFARYGVDVSKACPVPGNSDDTVSPPTDETETPAPPAETETPAPPADGEETEPEETASPDNIAFEKRVLELVNEQRSANGLAPLTLDEQLSSVARAKSQDMHDNKYFSHTSPTYGSPFDMLRLFGISYRTAGENIAMGYGSPEAVVSGWMNSPGHRANILGSAYTRMGVGYVADGNYWTQLFIG